MALSDRIVVMSQGRIEQIAPPHEAYERPATPFVANFLGKTNVLRGDGRERGRPQQRCWARGDGRCLPEVRRGSW